MRRFRFIGDQILADQYGHNPPIPNRIYNEDENVGKHSNKSILTWSGVLPNEWQEVFDEPKTNSLRPPKHTMDSISPLHKDTDLGYFAGLAMAALFVSYITETGLPRWGKPDLAKEAIEQAKELIKQLNEETK